MMLNNMPTEAKNTNLSDDKRIATLTEENKKLSQEIIDLRREHDELKVKYLDVKTYLENLGLLAKYHLEKYFISDFDQNTSTGIIQTEMLEIRYILKDLLGFKSLREYKDWLCNEMDHKLSVDIERVSKWLLDHPQYKLPQSEQSPNIVVSSIRHLACILNILLKKVCNNELINSPNPETMTKIIDTDHITVKDKDNICANLKSLEVSLLRLDGNIIDQCYANEEYFAKKRKRVEDCFAKKQKTDE